MKKPSPQAEDNTLFRNIIESISDPIVVLDKNWCYTYLNEKAEYLLGLDSENDLIGKNIWEEFPYLIGSDLHKACKKALAEQQYAYAEQYVANFSVWIENNIYPAKNGITIQFRNITARKLQEKEANKLAQRNTLIIEKMRDNFLLTDADMNIVDVNSALCNASGYSRKELLSMSVSDFYLKSKEEVKRNFKAVLESGILLVDTRIRKKNGEIADVEVTHTQMIIDGRTFIATFARDISAFKIAESALKKSNERFELIGNTTQDAVWEVEIETGNRWANEIHQKMFGLQKNDPVAGSKDWEKRIHTDVREKVISSLKSAIRSGKNKWLEEYPFYTDNSGWIDIYDRTYIVYNNEGKATRMLGSMLDITELKKAEQQILSEKKLSDSIINSLPGIFYLFDENGKFLRWNKNFETVSGYHKSEIAGMQPLDFYDTDEKEIIRSKIAKVFEEGMAEVDAHFFTKNKEKIPYYFNGWTAEFDGKKCLIGTGIDITELKKAEHAVHVMEEEILNQRVQEQKKISRTIINTQEKERNYIGRELHDNVNQILAGAKLYLSMAGKQNEKVKDLVKYPMELVDSSINEIRLLTHKHATPLRDVDLKQLIQNLVDNLNKSTSIKTNFVYNVNGKSISEELKINIYRIIQEQINNIVKHAHAENAEIIINATKGAINIITKDDGNGFDTCSQREGIGISNMINRIDSYNGELSVGSTPGKGCAINIKIPY